jgi:hypothetical protein
VDEDARRGLETAIQNLDLESSPRKLAKWKIPDDMTEIISKTAQKVLHHRVLLHIKLILCLVLKSVDTAPSS